MPVESIIFAGQQAWRKRYVAAPRVLPLAALAVIARLLELPPLTPPPRHPPGRALQLEERRLGQLQAMGVRAPRVLAKGEDWLALSHIGETLAGRLRLATGDPVATDALVRMAVAAISDAHRRGAYFGQPLPRNMAVDGTSIGFLDFEEDPLEVMTLEQAQARDWLLFAYEVARYYDERPAVLREILGEGLRSAHVEVSGCAYRVGRRLRPIARLVRGCGRSARAFAHAVLALR